MNLDPAGDHAQSSLLHTATAVQAASEQTLPLCIDLDGTLLQTNCLHEAIFAAIIADWTVCLRLPGWLLIGKAKLKEEAGRRWEFDPATLPYTGERDR